MDDFIIVQYFFFINVNKIIGWQFNGLNSVLFGDEKVQNLKNIKKINLIFFYLSVIFLFFKNIN